MAKEKTTSDEVEQPDSDTSENVELDEEQSGDSQDADALLKELEEYRKKDELRKSIDLLDEEHKRKLKRNLRNEKKRDTSTDDEDEEDLDSKIEKQVTERLHKQTKAEQEDALVDFIADNNQYSTQKKRDELLAEVSRFKDADTVGYRQYTHLLKRAHILLGGNTRSNSAQEFTDTLATAAGGGGKKDSPTDVVLTKEQLAIIKKTPGLTKKRFIEQLKADGKI